ncbi:meprin A subunit beta [Aplysia californica]|uniref:Metalloendopeptidase n=1 Tax=Aplysia californica TaxID=6500 RepID=A0ABM0JFL5_APLCA|nr:meprin A subunit beta [Aplysia californica]
MSEEAFTTRPSQPKQQAISCTNKKAVVLVILVTAPLLLYINILTSVSLRWKTNFTQADDGEPGQKLHLTSSTPTHDFLDDPSSSPQRPDMQVKERLWPSGVIPYVIDETYPRHVASLIKLAMDEIANAVNSPGGPKCIQFKPHETEMNYIEVAPGDTCSSFVGNMRRGRQEVIVGQGCEHKGVIMHELLHAVGFWHEHTRPDRDQYIDIHLNNVLISNRYNFEVQNHSVLTLNLPYDYGSIMHYSPYEFAINTTEPTITPKKEKKTRDKFGQRLGLTELDVKKIQRLYGCVENVNQIANDLQKGYTTCAFQDDFCVFRNDDSDDFDWIIQNGTSQSGPGAGNTNGLDNYLIAASAGHIGKVARLIIASHLSGSSFCVDFYVFQNGPSSFLKLVAREPSLPGVLAVREMRNYYHNKWWHVWTDVRVSPGRKFSLTFEAHIAQGDVAIDDINIYKGTCL